MVKSVLIASFGGFIGTASRFLISRYFQFNYASVFPWGTFTVNILGSLLIGIFFRISEKGNFMTYRVVDISDLITEGTIRNRTL